VGKQSPQTLSVYHFQVFCLQLDKLLLQGGMKATIWNDFIQMIVIIIGLILLIILGAIEVNGNFWKIADQGGRIEFDK
jgi:Na+(H+)/acetate symporter ActP